MYQSEVLCSVVYHSSHLTSESLSPILFPWCPVSRMMCLLAQIQNIYFLNHDLINSFCTIGTRVFENVFCHHTHTSPLVVVVHCAQPHAHQRDSPSLSSGMPVDVHTGTFRLWQIQNGSSFHGCIQNLYINNELQDFTKTQMKPGVVPGCEPCKKIYCVHGICQPDGIQGPVCHCQPGWSGPHCDEPAANPCQGSKYVKKKKKEEEQWMHIHKLSAHSVVHHQTRIIRSHITFRHWDDCKGGKSVKNQFEYFLPPPNIRCVHGRCIPLDSQSYRCECEEGYRGALCNQEGELFNPCRRLSCKHGRCQISDTGDAFCHCESGYTGELCDAGWFAVTHLKMKVISMRPRVHSQMSLPSRVRVSRRARAGLLPGPERLRHLPDNTHGVMGRVLRSVRQRSLLCQPADEASEIYLRMQRWHILQRGGGKDHQVWLHGLHVVRFAQISCRRCQGHGRKEGSKEGKERGLEESEGGKEGIKNIYKTSIYILWTTMFVK